MDDIRLLQWTNAMEQVAIELEKNCEGVTRRLWKDWQLEVNQPTFGKGSRTRVMLCSFKNDWSNAGEDYPYMYIYIDLSICVHVLPCVCMPSCRIHGLVNNRDSQSMVVCLPVESTWKSNCTKGIRACTCRTALNYCTAWVMSVSTYKTLHQKVFVICVLSHNSLIAFCKQLYLWKQTSSIVEQLFNR